MRCGIFYAFSEGNFIISFKILVRALYDKVAKALVELLFKSNNINRIFV